LCFGVVPLVDITADLIVSEPVPSMRTQAIEQLNKTVTSLRESKGGGHIGSIRVIDGSAERIPLPDQSVDVVVAAQAFHWFDAVAAAKEIRRVLKPGGRMGLIWNVRDQTDPLQQHLST
jgi:ubiquinone/menaquinone biosynthesis C-methylase UbiE